MKDLSECRVLLVDDAKTNLDILVEGLKGDHKLSLALNGEMALQIADRMGYSRDLAEPTDSSRLVGRAPRPADVSLDNRKARRILQTPMRTLAEGLDLVLQHREE